jgi:DNA-binding HxlR family transcriptional regulator
MSDARATENQTDRRPLPLEAALDRVGDRWSLLLVEALLDGPRRFGDLGEALPGIAPNILTDRLRRLERAGILRSSPYQDRPTRYAYELTADGRALASALRLLADWGARRSNDVEPLRHAVCGTALEARFFCPTCSAVVDAAEAHEERFL